MSYSLETAKIIDGVLRLIVVTGMIGGLVLAPNAAQLGGIALKKLDKRSRARDARRLVTYMEYRGLVDAQETNDGNLQVAITEKGRSRLTRLDFRNLQIVKPKVWDGMWRLVLFDIAETHRRSRIAFIRKLRALGFNKLQRSAWVYPYACGNEIEIVRQAYQIPDRDIVVAEVNLKDREKELKEYFKIDT